MNKIVILVLCLFSGFSLFGQDKIFLKNGEIIKGKIIQKTDSLVVIKTQRLINNETIDLDLVFYNQKIKKVEYTMVKKEETYVYVDLIGGKVIKGRLISNNDDGVVITDIRGSDIDTLSLKKRQIKQIRYNDVDKSRSAFFDVGFLRGGALIGAELEIVVNQNMTIFLGAGFRGYAGGLNIFFKDNFSGFGFKSSYIHQGYGDFYSGSILSNGFTYKSNPGLTLDLGIGYVMNTGNYNYGGREFILTYGIGLRF
ncbi:MAG: hypothetical protein IPN86_24505 [Saprospiraceae bacterium]|nr:hypothetical protein [Saprospiraceae bacterium]